jgi:septum site-determining protein MinC
MAFVQSPPKQPPTAFELRGRVLTLSVLRILTSDLEAFCRQLDVTTASAPELFQGFPVLLDFEKLPDESQRAFDIARLDRLLRERGLIPVGVCGAGGVLAANASEVGIGVMSASATREPSRRERGDERGVAAAAPRPAANMLIDRPVRSGQQVYAEGGDLIVLATVSPGAEIIADGNIHVYGTLRGRALAGARGNAEARIFCQRLDAELIAIAEHYRLSDGIQESQRGDPVQVFLDGDSLVIATF